MALLFRRNAGETVETLRALTLARSFADMFIAYAVDLQSGARRALGAALRRGIDASAIEPEVSVAEIAEVR